MSGRDEVLAKVALECGDISASQEELLARSSFLGGGGGEEEAEVLSTPPRTQDQHQQPQDGIAMCTQPFTPSSAEESAPRKPRVCTRKIRGARIRTPTPSPVRGDDTTTAADPLCRAVLMIPTRNSRADPGTDDILELARKRDIFF